MKYIAIVLILIAVGVFKQQSIKNFFTSSSPSPSSHSQDLSPPPKSEETFGINEDDDDPADLIDAKKACYFLAAEETAGVDEKSPDISNVVTKFNIKGSSTVQKVKLKDDGITLLYRDSTCNGLSFDIIASPLNQKSGDILSLTTKLLGQSIFTKRGHGLIKQFSEGLDHLHYASGDEINFDCGQKSTRGKCLIKKIGDKLVLNYQFFPEKRYLSDLRTKYQAHEIAH